MPKTIHLSKYDASGISITFTKTRSAISVSGWYDQYVGIEGETMTLGEFFRRLGITRKDCDRALRGEGE